MVRSQESIRQADSSVVIPGRVGGSRKGEGGGNVSCESSCEEVRLGEVVEEYFVMGTGALAFKEEEEEDDEDVVDVFFIGDLFCGPDFNVEDEKEEGGDDDDGLLLDGGEGIDFVNDL